MNRPAGTPPGAPARGRDREFFVGLARACAGAVIFALPMLMTMEMWSIGGYVSPWRLVVLLVVMVPLLTGLSAVSGFKPTETLRDDAADAFVAIAVAAGVSALVLYVLGIVTPDTPASEAIGRITLQVFPGGVGAMLARSQLAGESAGEEQGGRVRGYGRELFLMAVGALFLGLSVAATEEVVLLSYRMRPWQVLALAVLSLALMHAFVHAVESADAAAPKPGAASWGLFARYTAVGYAIVLLISLYLLWTFGRTDGTAFAPTLGAAIVLGFPCAVGAAAARLIL